mmetsp:Transcript_3643/g.3984  ORF Transcript_3643/g.3984 Transcript_3643/m.3984 type:complete len:165 (+) Transcript_3643:55-549(+)
MMTLLIKWISSFFLVITNVEAFTPLSGQGDAQKRLSAFSRMKMSTTPSNNEWNGDFQSPLNNDNSNTDNSWTDNTMEELLICTSRLKLEEANKQRFLKSRPIKLPYEQCKNWAQKQNMWSNADEWYEWVNLGEGWSAYIPRDPELYYSRNGSWVSWNDFLGTTN